jgi:hypothetical protein
MSVTKERRVEVGVLGSEASVEKEITEEAMMKTRGAMWIQLAR